MKSRIPVVGFAAPSGTGKTTLLKRLIPDLRRRGFRVGLVKHTHHDFEVDQPGKDSYELRKAGAEEVLLASGSRWALMADTGGRGDPPLQPMLERLDQSTLDLILIEGFKHESIPKLELHRPDQGRPPIYPTDPNIVALLCDRELPDHSGPPQLDINDIRSVADFIVSHFLPGQKAG